ncbi:hypothetical protein TQ94_29090 [Bacillus cereus]|uniref:Uncharacterized protein n=1 Tax=Bacillus cereus TaxID=1396 RepID=A0A9X0KCQ6_BACCE|nr:hypothetical protein TQ94_29090 [Bacillus cereus]
MLRIFPAKHATLFPCCVLIFRNKQHLIFKLFNFISKRSNIFPSRVPKFISHLSSGYALHTLEEGKFFREIR